MVLAREGEMVSLFKTDRVKLRLVESFLVQNLSSTNIEHKLALP